MEMLVKSYVTCDQAFFFLFFFFEREREREGGREKSPSPGMRCMEGGYDRRLSHT